MAAMKIDNPNTLKLLPVFMRDDEANIALAGVIDKLIKDPGSRAEQLRVWDQIDSLPEEMLDELAWELNIDWWEASWDLDKKRETIKTATLIKAHRGTVWAVEQVAKNIFGSAEVKEWHTYGGRPHHFKVTTDYPLDTTQLIEEFRRLVSSAKRASSVLDAIEFAYSSETQYHVLAGSCGAGIVLGATALNL